MLNTGTVPANKEYAAGTLSNVHICWLAMPLGAGVLIATPSTPPHTSHLDFVIRYIDVED